MITFYYSSNGKLMHFTSRVSCRKKIHSIKKAMKRTDRFTQSDFLEVFKEVKQFRLQTSFIFFLADKFILFYFCIFLWLRDQVTLISGWQDSSWSLDFNTRKEQNKTLILVVVNIFIFCLVIAWFPKYTGTVKSLSNFKWSMK